MKPPDDILAAIEALTVMRGIHAARGNRQNFNTVSQMRAVLAWVADLHDEGSDAVGVIIKSSVEIRELIQ